MLHTCGISIALTIRSFDPRWGLGVRGLVFYTSSWISIAVAIRSLDPTLGLLEAGAQGISIAVIIHSFDRTLQMHFSNRLLRSLWELYRGRLPLP